MGRAGKALKQTLATYKISQNRLAVVLGVDRAVVNRWYHEQVDPNAETVAAIVIALKGIKFEAAEIFVQRYLGDLLQPTEPSEPEAPLSDAREATNCDRANSTEAAAESETTPKQPN